MLLDRLAVGLDAILKNGALLVLPILFLTLTRLWLRARFPVTYALAGDWFSHSQYFAMFLLGAALARTQLIWPRMAQLRWVALLLALVAWVLLIQAQWLIQVANVPMRAIGPAVYSVQQWCAIVAALGFAQVHLNRDGPARRYLTQAVFPVYILHQTLILLLAHSFAPLALNPVLEGGLLVGLTFALSLAGFEMVRRLRWLRPLFGLAAKAN
jgi:surface polysaccharide O-acyltransferase-like enzyme